MLQPTHHPLPSPRRFLLRLLRNFGAASLVVAASLSLGAVGYHGLEHLSWLDSFYAAAMILTGMGPTTELKHDSTKLFAIFYALFSGIVFLSAMAFILAPAVHRFLHRFHLETQAERARQDR